MPRRPYNQQPAVEQKRSTFLACFVACSVRDRS
jgi:hypothetical protein